MNNITSKDNKKIKELMKLYDNKYREEQGLFIVEGYHLFEMAKEENLLMEVYATKLVEVDVPLYIITEDILKKISKTKSPQGIVCVCKMKKCLQLGDKVIYLDNIQDPGNLGTILRSALAFNFKDIIVSKDSVSIYNEKAISASQGALFKLNVLSVGDVNLLSRLKNEGYNVISTALNDSESISNLSLKEKNIIVFGNEGNGVRKEILDMSNQKVRIDMDNIDSLNVGVAASILMYLLK